MAQLVKCLLFKHQDLSSMPRTCIKKSGVVAYAWNAIRGRCIQAWFPGAEWSVNLASSRPSERFCLRKTRWMAPEYPHPGLSTYAHTKVKALHPLEAFFLCHHKIWGQEKANLLQCGFQIHYIISKASRCVFCLDLCDFPEIFLCWESAKLMVADVHSLVFICLFLFT